MNKEVSCGAVVLHDNKVLLINSIYGHWGFPKGHIEANEDYKMCAIREVKEETNIDIKIVSDTYYTNTYSPKANVMKDVHYFLANAINEDIINQEEEVSKAMWINTEDVMDILTYDIDKNIFMQFMIALTKSE